MNIGIIGVGEVGGTLARQYTRAGHTVKFSNATAIDKLEAIATETGATASSLADVVKDVDVIVISIPFFAA